MKLFSKQVLLGLLFSMFLLPVTSAGNYSSRTYEVSVTNLTGGQIMSPFVVATHNRSFSLFELGQPASAGLAGLAQDAQTDVLIDELTAAPGSREVAVSSGPILPGQTVTVEIDASGGKYLSLAAMLVTTNDAFIALNGIRIRGRNNSYYSLGYDAGAEDNDELCAYIPGPPCGNPGQTSGQPGEGYVYIHPGIQGNADLDTDLDWRNPVAKISIKRR